MAGASRSGVEAMVVVSPVAESHGRYYDRHRCSGRRV